MQRSERTVCAFVAGLILLGVFSDNSADAQLVVEESFDYEPGEIALRDGGIGFDGPWSSSVSHGRTYQTGITEFSNGENMELDEDGGLWFLTLPVAGSALSRFGSAGRAQANRRISAASQDALLGEDTTIWFSVLFAGSSGGFKHGSFLFGSYKFSTQGRPMLGDGDDDRNPPFTPNEGDGFGFTLQAAPDGAAQGPGSINALGFNGSAAPTVVEGTFTPPDGATHQETSLIVGKINWKAEGTPDEFFLFSVTDLSREPLEEEAIASITDMDLDPSEFDTVAMWDSNHSIFDEIRFGTTFESVVGGTGGSSFVRGDADASGEINITDGIYILNFLFVGGGDPPCADAADADGSNAINITDGIYVLNFLFAGGANPVPPWPDCGTDPDDDPAVTCEAAHPGCGV